MGRVIGFELNSQEPEVTASFYERMFGWKVGKAKWDYRAVTTGSGNSTGIDGGIAKGPAEFPNGIRLQIEVESIDQTIGQAVKHGAAIVRDRMEFDGFYLAYLEDPTGLGIGLIENKK
ncbi:VOC family protein [Metabacillus sp. 84]|uniref:VOC family protein n=1 Tax=unclassified Metabacillus TaxID=2675274 RepID=UPI003CEDCCCF